MMKLNLDWCVLSFVVMPACVGWYTDEVGGGVARLAVRNAGVAATLVNTDDVCGFASPTVMGSAEVDGQVGGHGVVTWRVTGCTLDFGDGTDVLSDCAGRSTRASGRITVWAERVAEGILTGDPAQPVVPDRDDAVRVEVTRMELDRFAVRSFGSATHLEMRSGTVRATVRPRMAAEVMTGACVVPTPNAVFDSLVLEEVDARIETDDRAFDVDVPRAALHAVVGHWGAQENSIGGSIVVWDAEVAADVLSSELDPDYDRERFVTSFSCNADMLAPIRYTCSIEQILAQSASRLVIQDVGGLLSAVDGDSDCGFAGLENIDPEQLVQGVAALVSDDETTLTLETEACSVGTEPGTTTCVGTNCIGSSTWVTGRATVSARKQITGEVDPGSSPINPLNRESVAFELGPVVFEQFGVYSVAAGATEPGPMLLMRTGTLHASLQPITGESADSPGVFDVATPVVVFSDVHLVDALVTLSLGKMQLTFRIDEAHLTAVNGTYDGISNAIAGWLVMDGERIDLPGNLPLDPWFEQETFDASYACVEGLLETI